MPTKIDDATKDVIEAALRAGVKPKRIMQTCGVSRSLVYKIAYIRRIPVKKPKIVDYAALAAKQAARAEKSVELSKRNADIFARFTAGETLQQIADDHGVTRERVRQITERMGGEPRSLKIREKMGHHRAILTSKPMTLEEASDAVGLSRVHTSRLAAYFGIRFEHRYAWDTPEIAALAERVKAGESIRAVANRNLKVGKWLSSYCVAHGIKLSHGRWRDRREPKPKVWRERKETRAMPMDIEQAREVKEAARLSYGKVPASQVADKFGVSRNVIIGHWYRMRKAGILQDA